LLGNRNTTGRGLVEVYNNCVDKPVKKFADTRTGAARLFKLAQDIHVESTPFDEAPKKTPQVAPLKGMTPLGIAPKSAPFSKENMGLTRPQIRKLSKIAKPRGKYAGKTIECLTMNRVVKNPRRENTHGFNSMGIIINAGGSVSYEEYIAQGGRPNDLAYDIEKGHVELV